MWNCQDKSFSKADERDEEFMYYDSYNPRTDSSFKKQRLESFKNRYGLKCLSYFFLGVVLTAMILYNIQINKQLQGTLTVS